MCALQDMLKKTTLEQYRSQHFLRLLLTWDNGSMALCESELPSSGICPFVISRSPVKPSAALLERAFSFETNDADQPLDYNFIVQIMATSQSAAFVRSTPKPTFDDMADTSVLTSPPEIVGCERTSVILGNADSVLQGFVIEGVNSLSRHYNPHYTLRIRAQIIHAAQLPSNVVPIL